MKLFIASLALIAANYSSAREINFVGQDFPPFNWENNKVVTGAMSEIMTEICKELKHTCNFKIVALARANKMLEEGEIDGVLSLVANADRDVYANLSTPVFSMNKSYMANKASGIPKMKSIKELEGWTVAAIRGSSNLKLAQKHQSEIKNLNIKEEVDYTTLVQRLKNNQYGKKAVIIGSEDVAQYFAAKEQVLLETIFPIEEQQFAVAFSKKKISSQELEGFNKTIKLLKDNGTVKKMINKYK